MYFSFIYTNQDIFININKMSKVFLNEIIKQSLAHIRKIDSLIQFNLRIDPFSSNKQIFTNLLTSLKEQQKMAQKLLLSHKVQPPLFTCPFIAKTGLLLSQCISLQSTNKNEQIIAVMEKSQQWVNDTLRQMNEKQVQQKQIRESIIKLRNVLEQFTEGQREKYGANNGIYSKMLKYMI